MKVLLWLKLILVQNFVNSLIFYFPLFYIMIRNEKKVKIKPASKFLTNDKFKPQQLHFQSVMMMMMIMMMTMMTNKKNRFKNFESTSYI